MNSLRGEPAQLIWDSGNPDELTYDQLEERLRARFGSTGMAEKFRAELQALRQQKDETLSHLHSQICRLMALAYPGATDSTLRNVIARDYFLGALTDRQLALKIREREPADLDVAYRLAIRQEAYMVSSTDPQVTSTEPGHRLKKTEDRMERRVTQVEKALKKQAQAPSHDVSQKVNPAKDSEQSSDSWQKELDALHKELQEVRKERDRCRDEREKFKADAQKIQNDKERELSRFRHLEQQLREAREKQQQTAPRQQDNTASGNDHSPTSAPRNPGRPFHMRCYNCDREGHFSRDCPEKQRARPKADGPAPNDKDDGRPSKDVKSASADTEDEESSTAYIRLRVNGFSVNCLLDTGAEVTLIPHSILDGVVPKKIRQKIHAANRTPIPLMGRVTLTATHGDHRMEIDGLVTRHVSSVILGLGWLKKRKAMWDFDAHTVRLDGRVYELHAATDDSESNVFMPTSFVGSMDASSIVTSGFRSTGQSANDIGTLPDDVKFNLSPFV